MDDSEVASGIFAIQSDCIAKVTLDAQRSFGRTRRERIGVLYQDWIGCPAEIVQQAGREHPCQLVKKFVF